MSARAEAKRKSVTRLQRYLLNPPVKVLVRLGLVPGYTLIETRGRRTGRRRRTVAGIHLDGGTGWVVAEHRSSGYVRNIESDPHVRLCLRGRWREATAHLLPDDDPVARLETFGRRTHASNVRRFGTDLLTLRFDIASSAGSAGSAPPGGSRTSR